MEKTVIINLIIDDHQIYVYVRKNTDYKVLKEYLRDTLSPICNYQNWDKLIEEIRDTAIPHFC